ncbi:serine/threonine protein kinase [Sulfolobus acidocaldarius SUSAZ]|nr:serine/threonine protein kinase [Sulfolobus acidocaldarius SUSAZ]
MEIVREIKRGAEAIIYEGYFAGIHAVFKKRIKKSYRNDIVDRAINESRTKLEAKMIYSALKSGVNVPAILLVDPIQFLIVMEYIEGTTLRDIFNQGRNLRELGKEMGLMISLLHKANIIHGDLTTTNMIYTDEGLFLIDFGLAKKSNDIEDFATDIHVLLRSLESVHSHFKDEIFEGFKEGYSTMMDSDKVIEKMKEIRMRGRYVEERRKKRDNTSHVQ